MKGGAYFYKHDFGRNKRGRKHLKLSTDGLKITWKAVGANEVVADGGATDRSSPAKSIIRSASFSRTTSISLADVSHIIYGPYTDTFAKKTSHDRVDQRWACFSLVLRESRTVDFAAENEKTLLEWLLGLQQLIAYFAPPPGPAPSERWTLPKLRLQKLRLKVSGESDRTGQGPYDVVLSAVLDVAQEDQIMNAQTTKLQAQWRKRNTQGKFQTAVQEMMEINSLIDELEQREAELAEKQEATAKQIEDKLMAGEKEEPPPKAPNEHEAKDTKKMQEYMLQMGEYSARQQLKIQSMQAEVDLNQQLTAEKHKISDEKRKLQNIHEKLHFMIKKDKMETLTPEQRAVVENIQKQLGVDTPRGTIKNADVRVVTLKKETQKTRLGIIFHQNTPNELLSDTTGEYMTPRGADGSALSGNETRGKVVPPIIKHLDPTGIAANVPGLSVGDQVLSVNGNAALDNVQAVSMLRAAVGGVKLAVTSTRISMTPRGAAPAAASKYSSGLRPINQ